MKILCENCRYNKHDGIEEPCKSCIDGMKIYGTMKGYKPTLKAEIEEIFRKDR